MPISAPMPNWKPSLKRVDALTSVQDDCTCRVNAAAVSAFSVTIVSELTNGWIGYVPTRKAFEENMGHVSGERMAAFDHMGYEVRSALSRGYLPGVGEAIAETAVGLLLEAHATVHASG